jgi:PKD repeat protein
MTILTRIASVVGSSKKTKSATGGVPPPVADFIGVPTTGNIPFTVTFTNQSTGSITSYLWNFGDGGTSTGTNPTHAYTTAGTYTVTLQATGPGGSNTRTRTSYVTAQIAVPTTVTQTGSTTGNNNIPSLLTYTLDAPAGVGGVTIPISASNGGVLSTASVVIAQGQTTQTATITRSSSGTSVVTMGAVAGLTLINPTLTFTSAAIVSSGTIVGPTLTAGVTGTRSWAVAQVVARGHLPAGSTLSGLQTTILSTWPDTSARHILVAGTRAWTAGTPENIPMTIGAPASGSTIDASTLVSRAPTVTVDAGVFGSASFGPADWGTPFYTTCTGPVMAQLSYRKQIGSDAHLVAFVEVRVYADGSIEFFPPWVENGYLLVAGPTNKNATYTCTINSNQVYTGTIDLKNHQRTPLISGTELSYWVDGVNPNIVVQHDRVYLQQTRMVPSYSAVTPPSDSTVTGQPSSFTPLQQGSFPPGMGAAGYHPSIAVLPQWDVLYLTTTASMWAVVQRQGFSAGRYGIHFRDETTNYPARLSSYPNLVLNGSSGITATGSSSIGTETPGATGGSPPSFYTSHHPSMGYMAYLLTGWRFHLETAQFVAVANSFKQTDITRGFTQGILKPNAGANTTRGAGWAIRSLAQVAAITPDTDPMKAEFVNQFGFNIDYYHARYVAQPNNPLGWVTPYSDYSVANFYGNTQAGSTATSIVLPAIDGNGNAISTVDGFYNGRFLSIAKHGATTPGQRRTIINYVASTRTVTVDSAFTFESGNTMPGREFIIGDGVVREAWWMQDFVTAGFGHAVAIKPNVSQERIDKLRGFFQWKARSIVDRFGNEQTHQYLYRDAAQFEAPVAPCDLPDFDTGRGPWFANAGAQWDAVWTSTPPSRTVGDLRGGNFPSASSYWGNLMPAFSYAVEEGIVGAITGWRRMTNASNWNLLQASLNTTPEWSTVPAGGVDMPTWAASAPAWEWIDIPNSRLSDTPPTVVSAGNPQNKLYGYTGAALKRRGSVYMLGASGGHTDYAGNEVNTLTAGSAAPAWSEVKSSTPLAQLYYNSPYYADHRPGAAHTYHAAHYNYTLDSLIVYMRTGVSGGFPGVTEPPSSGWPYVSTDGWSKVFRFERKDWVLGNEPNLPVPYNSVFGGLNGVNTDVALGFVDPKTDNYFMSGGSGGGWWKFTVATKTWATTGGGNRSPWYAGTAVDWTRERVWVVGGFAPSAPILYNYTGTTSFPVTYTGDGVASLTFQGGYPAAVYDPKNDTYLAFFQDGTGSIKCRRVQIATLAVSTPVMTGNIPGDRPQGIHNSVQYSEELEGVIATPSYTANARFMRIN